MDMEYSPIDIARPGDREIIGERVKGRSQQMYARILLAVNILPNPIDDRKSAVVSKCAAR
jgi:hypothetical protein